jgi:hypothetical protein
MHSLTIKRNEFLQSEVPGFYHTDYVPYERRNEVENYPVYLLTLKNDPNRNWWDSKLREAKQQLLRVLLNDLPKIFAQTNKPRVTVCVVPRAKANDTYRPDQLLFKEVVKSAVVQLGDNFIDGTNFIERHTSTKTTHLRRPIEGFINDGEDPYPGISLDSCHFSQSIIGSDIILIDDIYTENINIDEDMIQALRDKGANSIIFYAIGKTKSSDFVL